MTKFKFTILMTLVFNLISHTSCSAHNNAEDEDLDSRSSAALPALTLTLSAKFSNLGETFKQAKHVVSARKKFYKILLESNNDEANFQKDYEKYTQVLETYWVIQSKKEAKALTESAREASREVDATENTLVKLIPLQFSVEERMVHFQLDNFEEKIIKPLTHDVLKNYIKWQEDLKNYRSSNACKTFEYTTKGAAAVLTGVISFAIAHNIITPRIVKKLPNLLARTTFSDTTKARLTKATPYLFTGIITVVGGALSLIPTSLLINHYLR